MSKRKTNDSTKESPKKPKQDSGESASVAAEESKPTAARYFALKKINIEGSQSLKEVFDEKAPEGDDAIKEFIEKNELREGDLVNFGEDRDVETYITAKKGGSGELYLVCNPDDSSSGYLTIPAEALKNVSNFFSKYESIIKAVSGINFKLDHADDYLRSFLGSDVPAEGWEFDVMFSLGERESFCARPAGKDKEFQDFELEGTSWKDIEEFFTERSGDIKNIKVKVSLKGDKFEAYKSKFSETKATSEWMKAKPTLPKGWNSERGKSSGGSDEFTFEWLFSGPASSEAAVKTNIDSFLEDFTFAYL